MLSTDYVSAEELKALGREPREAFVPGFPGYLVDEMGRVWSCRGMWYNPGGVRNWRPHGIYLKGGYYHTTLYTEDGETHEKRVRDLVAAAFIGPKPAGHKLLSKDRDKSNHRLANLEYSVKGHPPVKPWTGTNNAKIGPAEVIAIRRRAHAGESLQSLAAEWGMVARNIQLIVTRKSWPEVDAGVPAWTPDRVKRAPRSPLTPEQVADIETQVRHGRAALAIWKERYRDVCSRIAVYRIAWKLRPKGKYELTKAGRRARKKAGRVRSRNNRKKAKDGKALDGGTRPEAGGEVVRPAE